MFEQFMTGLSGRMDRCSTHAEICLVLAMNPATIHAMLALVITPCSTLFLGPVVCPLKRHLCVGACNNNLCSNTCHINLLVARYLL